MRSETPDRLNLYVWLLLVIVGLWLAVVGWYRVFSG
jgi:hypothetical protein